MDSYKGHIIVGSICASLVFTLFDIWQKLDVWHWILLILIIPYYSILPDIDQKQSKAREWTTLIGILFSLFWIFSFSLQKVYSLMPTIVVLSLLGFLWSMRYLNIFFAGDKPFAHRGIWHGFVMNALTSGLLLSFDWIIALGGFSAFTSHLIADKVSSFLS